MLIQFLFFNFGDIMKKVLVEYYLMGVGEKTTDKLVPESVEECKSMTKCNRCIYDGVLGIRCITFTW